MNENLKYEENQMSRQLNRWQILGKVVMDFRDGL